MGCEREFLPSRCTRCRGQIPPRKPSLLAVLAHLRLEVVGRSSKSWDILDQLGCGQLGAPAPPAGVRSAAAFTASARCANRALQDSSFTACFEARQDLLA